MGIGSRNRKRVLIFLLVPILVSIPFFTDDIILKIISSLLLLLYVGFIIFLRDSLRLPNFSSTEKEIEEYSQQSGNEIHESDDGEGFEFVSPNKSLEVLSASDFSSITPRKPKTSFIPSDLKENFEKIASEKPPANISHDEQFAFILEKILTVIKEAYLAHTSIFFWYNKRKNLLTLEKYVSSSSAVINQKYVLEDDILSKIVQKEEPQLLTNITTNAESDVIRYYNTPQGIKSFIGVPLYYGVQIAGVLGLDSKESDAFGIETIYSLGRFVRVISSIITLFDEKFSESQSEQRLKSLLGILASDKKFETENELYEAIENSVKNLISCDAFTFVYFNPHEQKFKTSKINNKTSLKYIGENLEIELAGTLVGKSILSGMPIKIDDTSTLELPRFSKSEDLTFDGSFLAIPLTYDDQNYGVLCFESLKKNVYTNADVAFMKRATKIFAYIVYAHSTHSVLKGLLSLDLDTRLMNEQAFKESVKKDLFKANKLEVPGALALIKIDEFLEEGSLFEGDPFPKVLKTISQILTEEQTELVTIGRIKDKVFGVYFFNSTTKDIFLWAEKLRIKIARKPIAVVSKQTTFTVSIGVATASNRVDIDEIIYNADLALKKAIEKGGNTVKTL
ncbi:MAG: GAF domain-containing protein [Bacteroidetes bacterium]|nr:GAF domain-containing protein [Bacteroidota bacterium]MBU1677436.1 GAF domain-containing protein [Bacteroidota bacterium]MBU2506165.1 GAF domain-containing protein [Bacteroidota bacterium]